MRKILSVLLCLCMFMSLVPFAASATEDNVDTLEMFGFKPDPDTYDTNALKPGTHPIEPKSELYIGNYANIERWKGQKTEQDKLLTMPRKRFYNTLNKSNTYTSKETTAYSETVGFSATSKGVDDHYAKVYFNSKLFSETSSLAYLNTSGYTGGHIQMSIYDANGNVIVSGFETGGYVSTSDSIEMWEAEGLLSVTAGDFDGDGIDEIAVYTPNNADETSNGSVHSNISVGIFEFDIESKTITSKQYLDLPSKDKSSDICEWEYSYNGGSKQFYCLPYVAFCAEDVSGDGIDDLMAVLNFSTWYRGGDGTKTYSTKQLIDHNTYFASVLEGYEGVQGGNLKQVIKHRVLVTDGLGTDTKYRYILRHANITVGDVTAEGSKEIIIGGWYTRANYKTQTSTTTVTANRFVWVDEDNAPRQIVGYTNYDNLKKKNTYDANSDYHWTVQETGNGWIYWYNEDATDSGPITTPLCAYKCRGTGKPDTIFLGGQFFDYDSSTGALKFTRNYEGNSELYHGSDDKKRKTSVVWMGKAVSANVSNDMFGREMLMFPFYYKVSGETQFTCKLLTHSEETCGLFKGGSIGSTYLEKFLFEDISGHRLISLALLDARGTDGNGMTSYITYSGDDTEVYFSDVEVLAIMQAPPLYEELNDDTYLGNSATGFAKSEGSGEGTSHGGSLTAGVVAGFEQETSFLGLFKVAGAEYELSITGTASYEHSIETSYDYSTGFETSGTTDAVVIFAVPYVRYNCTMYVPAYSIPTKEQYNVLCAFRDELIMNMENYLKTGEIQETGTYVKGCVYYEYRNSSYVTEDNFEEQQATLCNVAEEIDFIEKAVAECGKGGTRAWGENVEGAVLPYHYCIPQTPMVTTVDAKTYDAIAEVTPGLDKIYGNVFPDNYRPGDPTTYAHSIGELNADGNVLQSKQSIGGSNDGFLTNSNTSGAGIVQSQSISVEKATSDTIGWGAAIENTSLANVGGAKVGFTVSAEYNGSSVRTTTNGNEYSGAVVTLPSDTPAGYSYDWKLVSYNAKLNGSKVPVVGYLTRLTTTPPASIAQNISIDNITDRTATISWEDGDRTADYYRLSRVYTTSAGAEELAIIADNITSQDGKCSYTITNLTPAGTSYYVLESFKDTAKGTLASVPTDRVIITTLPENFSADIAISGFDGNVIYRNGRILTASADVTGNTGYDTLYQWQINEGEGWTNIKNKTAESLSFEASPLYNGKSIRCSAIIVISDKSSCTIYSEPLSINCAKAHNGYNVDWDTDENKVTITPDEGAIKGNIYLGTTTSDGTTSIIKPISEDGTTFDMTDIPMDNTTRVYVWEDNLKPVTKPFER